MPPTIEMLLEHARTLGKHAIVFPIDILECANAIAEHPDRISAIGPLKAMARCDSNFARHVAVRALWLIGAPALDDAALSLAAEIVMQDDANHVRAEAVRMLAAGKRAELPWLRALSHAAERDDTDYVREAAADAIRALTGSDSFGTA